MLLTLTVPDRSKLRRLSGNGTDGQCDTYIHLDGRVYVHDAWGQWYLLTEEAGK